MPTTSNDTDSGPHLAYSANRYRAELREVSDRELLSALAQNDELALDEIIERKSKALAKLAFRILGDAEESRDIVQMTFFRLWEHRHRFDGKWSPNTWIYRIATNLAIDQLRSRRSRQRSAEPMRLHLQGSCDTRAHLDRASLHNGEVLAIFHELAAGLTEKTAGGIPAAGSGRAAVKGGGQDRRLPGVDGEEPPIQRPQDLAW